MGVVVRKALGSEAAVVREIQQLSFREYQSLLHLETPPVALTESEAEVAKGLRDNTVFLAIYNQMKPIGSIRVRLLTPEVAYISRFAVLPNWQKSGAGSLLMEQAVAWSKAQGAKAIALHTAVKLIPLARFYHAAGFYVYEVDASRAYRRGLFIKELTDCEGMDFHALCE
ncbi:MAG: GNAT family N-acetyltransferase [Eubacteriales bacterium]|nr:GNAT family N-acetyltransferase [Eubacteriales bacterium]